MCFENAEPIPFDSAFRDYPLSFDIPKTLTRLDDSLNGIGDYSSIDGYGRDTAQFGAELDEFIKRRTGGLLEVYHRHHHDEGDWERGVPDPTGTQCDEFIYKLEFFHPSLSDFLYKDEVWEFEYLKIRDTEFCAAATISLCHLFDAICLFHCRGRPLDAFKSLAHIGRGLIWGAKADAARPLLRTNIFWELHRYLVLLHDGPWPPLEDRSVRDGMAPTKPCSPEIAPSAENFATHLAMSLAANFGATNFPRACREEFPLRFAELQVAKPHCGCDSLLYSAATFSLTGLCGRAAEPLFPDFVRFLISTGCDPNAVQVTRGRYADGSEDSRHISPWIAWLDRWSGEDGIRYYDVMDGEGDRWENELALGIDVAMAWLEGGADPDAGQEGTGYGKATWRLKRTLKLTKSWRVKEKYQVMRDLTEAKRREIRARRDPLPTEA